jgi:uncharacterized protein (TIGR02246 family)
MNARTSETTPARDEAEIRQLMEDWMSALSAKDLDRLMKHYAPEVRFFDAVPPFQHQGAAAYRGSWEACFPYLPPSIGAEMRGMKITVGGDTAFAHGFTRVTNRETGQAATCGWVRATVCFQRRDGTWKVVHEHVSVPFDPQTGKAALMHEL